MKARVLTKDFMKSRCRCDEDDGCWLWLESVGGDGAPRVRSNGKSELAARVMWRLWRGQEPSGALFSTCGAKRCINPAHRLDVSRQDLPRLQSKHGRTAKGAQLSAIRRSQIQRNAKVTSIEKAREIRRMAETMRYREISAAMGISKSLVGQVVRGQKWREGILA